MVQVLRRQLGTVTAGERFTRQQIPARVTAPPPRRPTVSKARFKPAEDINISQLSTSSNFTKTFNPNGTLKSLVAKPQQYVAVRKGDQKTFANYTPRIISFDDQGRIVSDVQRIPIVKRFRKWKDSQRTEEDKRIINKTVTEWDKNGFKTKQTINVTRTKKSSSGLAFRVQFKPRTTTFKRGVVTGKKDMFAVRDAEAARKKVTIPTVPISRQRSIGGVVYDTKTNRVIKSLRQDIQVGTTLTATGIKQIRAGRTPLAQVRALQAVQKQKQIRKVRQAFFGKKSVDIPRLESLFQQSFSPSLRQSIQKDPLVRRKYEKAIEDAIAKAKRFVLVSQTPSQSQLADIKSSKLPKNVVDIKVLEAKLIASLKGDEIRATFDPEKIRELAFRRPKVKSEVQPADLSATGRLTSLEFRLIKELERTQDPTIAARNIFGATIVSAALGVLGAGSFLKSVFTNPVKVVKDVAKTIKDPMPVIQAAGRQFVANPAGFIANWIAYQKALGLVGKGVKRSAVGRAIAEEFYILKQPPEIRPWARTIIKAAKAQEKIQPFLKKAAIRVDFAKVKSITKIEAKALAKTMAETDTFLFGSAIRGALPKKLRKLLPEAKDVDIATANINTFNKAFLDNIPKAQKFRYVIDKGKIYRQVSSKGKAIDKFGVKKIAGRWYDPIMDVKPKARLRPGASLLSKKGFLPVSGYVRELKALTSFRKIRDLSSRVSKLQSKIRKALPATKADKLLLKKDIARFNKLVKELNKEKLRLENIPLPASVLKVSTAAADFVPTQKLVKAGDIKIIGFGEQTSRKALGTLQVLLEKNIKRAKDPQSFLLGLKVQVSALKATKPLTPFGRISKIRKINKLTTAIKLLESKAFARLLEKKVPGLTTQYPLVGKISVPKLKRIDKRLVNKKARALTQTKKIKPAEGNKLPTIPSKIPSKPITELPSEVPSRLPVLKPSVIPRYFKSKTPFAVSRVPSRIPKKPSKVPSKIPSRLVKPSQVPSKIPSKIPILKPSAIPKFFKSKIPVSKVPSKIPKPKPSRLPKPVVSKIPILKPRAFFKVPKRPKPKEPKIEEQLDSKKKKKKLIKALLKRRFIYLPDFWSLAFGVKVGSVKEKAGLLKAGRVFSGLEERKLLK